MKLKLIILIVFVTTTVAYSQEKFTPNGSAFATIYANFHQKISSQTEEGSAFELERAYIGYEYNLSPEFYAKVNVDIGSPNDLSEYSKLRRYAYFKNAYLRYSKSKFVIEFGLIGMKQFKLQEKIWERRYLMKSLADEYKLGSSADLGININYTFNDYLDVDFTISNGEGYNNIQTDDFYKYGLGLTYTQPKNLTSKVFFDVTEKDLSQSTLLLFSSYDYNNKFNLSAEYINRLNNDGNTDENINAYSIFCKYNITDQYQFFSRFDKVESNILEGDIQPWNLSNDGSALVVGIQYAPIDKIKIALNYHDWYPSASNQSNDMLVYLNLEIKM